MMRYTDLCLLHLLYFTLLLRAMMFAVVYIYIQTNILSYLLYHAGLRPHNLDPVRVVGQLVRRVGEESVHDGRI